MTAELDTWSIVETAFDVRNNRHYEGLMAIGSGPLQQRASLEEGLSADPQDVDYLRIMGNVSVADFPPFKSRVGTYMPGVSGPHPTCRDELINLPAIHGLIVYADGERLDLERGRISDYCRRLDLRTGRLTRELTWHTERGTRLAARFERFISARRRHVMALRCTIRHLGGPATELRLTGTLDADVRTNGFDHCTSIQFTGEHGPITARVRTNGGDEIGAAVLMTSRNGLPWQAETGARWAGLTGTHVLDPGAAISVCKLAALTSSRHVASAPVDVARRQVWEAAAPGFDALAAESDAVWQERWERTDVVIAGDLESQLALRVSLYHLLRAVVEDDPRCAIDAKAAAGEAYCGRYFWDTEIFMLPAFLYTRPEVGKTLARFRVRSLPGARRNAARQGYRGARYAWESSPSGDEHCPNWQYADHEVHITADVAYGLWHAHLVDLDDVDFLVEVVEVLTETARYWCERATPSARGDGYELLGVMGPDEYTLLSRNNAYTNRMVALSLHVTADAWRALREQDAARADALRAQLSLTNAELACFAEIGAKLRVPYDAKRRLVLQSDDFFALEAIDLNRWWPDRSRPFGTYVSQERLYRSQVLKQADVVQLMALFPHEFDREQLRSAYETYEPLTTHDSSLSRPIHALVAAWIGKETEAFRLWKESSEFDLRPGMATEGIHAACAGANWQTVVFGFAGLRTRMQSNTLRLDPRLPREWTALRFPLVWCGQPLRIQVEHQRIKIEHRGTAAIDAQVYEEVCRLAPGHDHIFEALPMADT